MSLSKKQQILFYFCIGFVFILSWVFYYKYHQRIAISSDSSTMLPVASDLISGNLLLKGWVLGTNNFIFTETIFYSIGMLLGVSNPTLIGAIPSLFYSMFIITMIIVFVFRDEEYEILLKEKVVLSIFYLVIVGIVSVAAAYTLLNANSHNNLYFWIILCWFLVTRYYDTRKMWYLITFTILSILIYFSESVTSMVLFAPVGVYCLYEIWKGEKENRKSHLFVIGSLILSFLAGKGITIIIEKCGGLVTRGLPIHIVSLGEALKRLVQFIPQINVLFGYDGLNSTGFTSLSQIYNLFIFTIIIGWLVSLVFNTIKYKSLSRMDKVLHLIAMINFLACIFTDVVVFHRYIVPAYAFGTLLLIKTIFRLCAGRWKVTIKNFIVKAIIITTVCLTILCFRYTQIKSLSKYGLPQQRVIELIEEKKYGDGYGDFWCSSAISYYSDFKVAIYPVITSDSDINAYPELIRKDWYNEKDKHFIITYTDDSSIFINKDVLYNLLGAPDDSFIQDNYEVLYWEKDISGYIKSY